MQDTALRSNQEILQAVQAWLVLHSYARETQRQYRKHIEWAMDWFAARGFPTLADPRIAVGDVQACLEAYRPLATDTLFRQFRARLLWVFQFLKEKGWRETSPAPPLVAAQGPSRPLQLVHILSAEEIQRCIQAAWQGGVGASVNRALLILALPMYAGTRVSEIVDLRWRDLRNNRVRLGHGDTYREIPLEEPLKQFLEPFTDRAPNAPVLPAVRRERPGAEIRPLSANQIMEVLRRIYRAAGVPAAGIEPLRQVYARYLAAQGLDAATIRYRMGIPDVAWAKGEEPVPAQPSAVQSS